MSSLFKGEKPPSLPHNPSSQFHESGNLLSSASGPTSPAADGKTSKDGAPRDTWPAEYCLIHESCNPTEVEIDPRGDLTLLVGEIRCRRKKKQNHCETVAFRVCSRTVARAARAFDTMLYGRFIEARQSESDWTVPLPEDDPAAMAILLQVMHGRFDTFDSSPFHDTNGLLSLYKITVLTDKYDLTHLLRPWAERLVHGLETSVESLSFHDLKLALWISWELGSSGTFKYLIERLVWETEDDTYLSLKLIELPGVRGMISSLRRQAIDDLLKPVTSTVTKLTAGKLPDESGFQCKRGGAATSTCNLTALASLIQSLHSLELWPLPDSETWYMPASILQDTLCNLKIQHDPNHQKPRRDYGGYPNSSQKDCQISVIKDGRVYWCPNISVVPTDEQLNHLKLQAVKLGSALDG